MSTIISFCFVCYTLTNITQILLDAINKAALSWGIICLRYEIRDIKMPERVAEAMQLQVEAERNKRAKVLESEGQYQS